MGTIEKFYPRDAAKDPDAVLEQAVGAFTNVLIIGWNKDGEFEARADMGLVDGANCLWLVEVFKAKLLDGDFMGDPQ